MSTNVAFTQCVISPQDTTVCAGTQLSLSVDQDTASQNLWMQLSSRKFTCWSKFFIVCIRQK